MNKTELNNILDGLRSMYGNDKFPKLTEFAMDMWFESMKDLDYKQTKIAIANYIKVGKFPPTVADIREHYSLVDKEVKSDLAELKAIFSKMRNYYPGGNSDVGAEETFFFVLSLRDKKDRLAYAKAISNTVVDYVKRCEQGVADFNKTLSQCIEWADGK